MKEVAIIGSIVLTGLCGALVGSTVTKHNLVYLADQAYQQEIMTHEQAFVAMGKLGFLEWERMCAWELGRTGRPRTEVEKTCAVDFQMKDVFGKPVR